MKRELLDKQQNKIIVQNNVTLKRRLSIILFIPAVLALCLFGAYLEEMSFAPISLKDILFFSAMAAPFVFYVSYRMWKDLEAKIILTNEKIIRKQPFSKDFQISWSDIKQITIYPAMKGYSQDRTRIHLRLTRKKQSSLSKGDNHIFCPSGGFFSKDNPRSRDAVNLILRNIDLYNIPIKGERELMEEIAEKPDKSLQGTARPAAYRPENMVGVPGKGMYEKQLQVMWIIWAAMLVSLAIYVLICLLWGDVMHRYASPLPLELMRDILYGIAILTVILTHFLRNFILGGRSGGSGPMSSKPPSPPDQSSVAGKYVTAMMVSLALSESIGIYGLVLFFLGDDLRTVFMFNGIAAIAMFFYRPKRKELETLSLGMEESIEHRA